MSKQVIFPKNADGWIYYVDWRFAWLPAYCQGQLVWLRRVWFTWPEKDGKPIYAADVMSDWRDSHPNGYNPQMYLTEFPYDPRRAQ